jgi:hypothetical protein
LAPRAGRGSAWTADHRHSQSSRDPEWEIAPRLRRRRGQHPSGLDAERRDAASPQSIRGLGSFRLTWIGGDRLGSQPTRAEVAAACGRPAGGGGGGGGGGDAQPESMAGAVRRLRCRRVGASRPRQRAENERSDLPARTRPPAGNGHRRCERLHGLRGRRAYCRQAAASPVRRWPCWRADRRGRACRRPGVGREPEDDGAERRDRGAERAPCTPTDSPIEVAQPADQRRTPAPPPSAYRAHTGIGPGAAGFPTCVCRPACGRHSRCGPRP